MRDDYRTHRLVLLRSAAFARRCRGLWGEAEARRVLKEIQRDMARRRARFATASPVRTPNPI